MSKQSVVEASIVKLVRQGRNHVQFYKVLSSIEYRKFLHLFNIEINLSTNYGRQL